VSSAIKTGGTAFPMQDPQAIHAYAAGRTAGMPADQVDERDRVYLAARAEAVGGMSLRDYFAAKAMQVCLAQANSFPDEHWRDGIARDAYVMADAMLKAREGGAA
jgi:hypothetical protein